MKSPNLVLTLSSLAAALAFGPAYAKSTCPASVTGGVQKAYPESKTKSCKQEKVEGKIQYEAVIKTKDARKIEIDLSPDGAILLTEEKVPMESLPAAVTTAFETKYPKDKILGAEKQAKTDGDVTFELAFKDNGKKHQATFKDDGTFVELE